MDEADRFVRDAMSFSRRGHAPMRGLHSNPFRGLTQRIRKLFRRDGDEYVCVGVPTPHKPPQRSASVKLTLPPPHKT